MLTVKQSEIPRKFYSFRDRALKGEIIKITSSDNNNIIMVSECEYNKLLKAKHNAKYIEKLDKSFREFEEGKLIEKTIEELEEFTNDDFFHRIGLERVSGMAKV